MSESAPDWEPVDAAAASVLAALSLVIVGGLATGIVGWQGTRPFGESVAQVLSSDLGNLTGAWGNLFTGVFALAAIVIVRQFGSPERQTVLGTWAEVIMCLVMVGTLVAFVAEILADFGQGGTPRLAWAHDIESASEMLGVLLMGTVGVLIGGHLLRRLAERRERRIEA